MKRILNQDAELTIRDKIANWIFFAALRIEEIVEGIKLSNFQMRDKCFQLLFRIILEVQLRGETLGHKFWV